MQNYLHRLPFHPNNTQFYRIGDPRPKKVKKKKNKTFQVSSKKLKIETRSSQGESELELLVRVVIHKNGQEMQCDKK